MFDWGYRSRDRPLSSLATASSVVTEVGARDREQRERESMDVITYHRRVTGRATAPLSSHLLTLDEALDLVANLTAN